MFFPNMVLGIRVLHSRRKVDQDGYIYICDKDGSGGLYKCLASCLDKGVGQDFVV